MLLFCLGQSLSSLLIFLDTYRAVITLLRLYPVRRGRPGKKCPMFPNVESKAKIEAKRFALSVQKDKISEPFLIMGTPALPLFIILLVIFQNSRNPICLFSIWAWIACEWLHITLSRAFLERSLAVLNAVSNYTAHCDRYWSSYFDELLLQRIQ